jgi:hypothetical protein
VGWGVVGWGTCEITRVNWEEMDMVRDLEGRWDVIHNQSIEMTLHARTIWEARHEFYTCYRDGNGERAVW